MEENRVVLANLPTTVRGIVFYDENYDPVIVVNARLTREANWYTFIHERLHILHGDLDDPDYNEYGGD